MFNGRLLSLIVLLGVLAGCDLSQTHSTDTVSTEQLPDNPTLSDAAIASPGVDQWLSYGRDYSEQRFVPSTQINKSTVDRLGLAYSVDIATTMGSVATPILVDGLLIFPVLNNIVIAVDAKTGEQRWQYDPISDLTYARVHSAATARGVAVYEGKVIIPTLDGRLIAVSLNDGKKIWEVNTFDGGNCTQEGELHPCVITGAPRVARGKVFIGFGGAELNARGYISAYDASTGEFQWRFYTVPNDPDKAEHPEMELAAKTWSDGWWKDGVGGGGTVWDNFVFDEEYNQLIIGTGNAGALYPRHLRSPGGGDNLFLSSIIALDVDTGRMNWYYQQTPGEQWDYTATQSLILAELKLGGEPKKVVMQAPKNGFFYVLDRSDGKLLSAEKYAEVNWAEYVDLETGRPLETEQADYSQKAKWTYPSGMGANNWHPMAYNPNTGLAYISGREGGQINAVSNDIDSYKVMSGIGNTGLENSDVERLVREAGPRPGSPMQGYLKAYDPVKQKLVWKKPMRHFWNTGVVATGGDLVFVGDAMGMLEAYDARTGEVLWRFDTYVSLVASPISYELDGVQYVAILAGSGAAMNWIGYTGDTAAYKYGNQGKLMVFKLDGEAELKQPPLLARAIPQPPQQTASQSDIDKGARLFLRYCAACHGSNARSSSIIPDLRKMTPETHTIFKGIVLEGWFKAKGMLSFANVLSEQDADKIYAYILSRAHKDFAHETAEEVEIRGGL